MIAHRKYPPLQRPATPGRFGQNRAFWALRAQHLNRRRRQQGGGAPEIASLDTLPDLFAEYVADATTMVLSGLDVNQWWINAGDAISAPDLFYSGGGHGCPTLMYDQYGPGRNAVYFLGGKFDGGVSLATENMTAVLVGCVDFFALEQPFPRFLGVANYGLSEEDWASPNTWVVMCYNTVTGNFVADRNWSNPVNLPFDPSKNYVIATRKSGGTITAWLRPFGEATATASGPTDNVGLDIDMISVGGNLEPQNLHGLIAHIGIWTRGLTNIEVESAMDYLAGLYE